jgi:predicted unusual protein kinase regulating ubiquinone biosynthesis (AarF/ABC1/UbiB family)
MIFPLNYIKLSLWAGIYRFYYGERTKFMDEIILYNIFQSGCVTVKLTQWFITVLNANLPEINMDTFLCVFEKCYEHPLKHTLNIYESEMKEPLSKRFDIVNVVSSASMGQVYKLKEKKSDKLFALKVLHPHIERDIWLIEICLYLLYYIPWFRKWLDYYIPLDIHSLINDFKCQSNMVQEANNCLRIKENFKKAPFVRVPDIIQVSNNTLLMSFEEGIPFKEWETTTYKKWKTCNYFMVMLKNFFINDGFVHGDLHFANWKVVDSDDPQLILYDFGFCCEVPDRMSQLVEELDDCLVYLDFSIESDHIRITDSKKKEITGIVHACFFPELDISVIEETLNENEFNIDGKNVIHTVFKLARRVKKRLDHQLIQASLVWCQVQSVFNHRIVNSIDDYYNSHILDMVTICDSYQCFPEVKKACLRCRDKYNKTFQKSEESLFEGLSIK